MSMRRAVWRQALARDNEARFAAFYEDTEPYDLMESVVDACNEHLATTSLEHLASASEDDAAVPPAEFLLMRDSAEVRRAQQRLLQLFLRDFHKHNDARHDLLPTRNELAFMALMLHHYCTAGRRPHWASGEPALRYGPPEEAFRDLLDSRCRLAQAMCRHGHAIRGAPYETRAAKAERRRENRMDMLCPTSYTLVEWHELRKRQQDEDAAEALADQAMAMRVRRFAERRRLGAGDDDALELPTWRRPAPPPDVAALQDEVSFFVACYYCTVGLDGLAPLVAGMAGVDVSPRMAQARRAMTNAAEGTAMGLLWSVDPATAPALYLQMACQFFAQLWAEQAQRARLPVVLADDDYAAASRALLAYVADRMDTEVQEGQVKELSYNAYSLLLPVGAKGLAKRVWGGVGSSMRAVLNKMCGGAVIHELDEMFDTQAAMQLIGYDAHHPLHDALCMTIIQSGCFCHDNDFSMVSRCMASSVDQLDKMAERKAPVIARLCGEWLVMSKGSWHRPATNSFCAAWLLFLRVLKRQHGFAMDTMSNLGYWEGVLGCSL
jgi:hypothetical protein